MQALIVTEPDLKSLQQVVMPTPGRGEALVRILGCGICNSTDRALIRGKPSFNQQYPLILGHEAVGEVIALGPDMRRFVVGDRVTRPSAVWPGEQLDGAHSGWGGFAEYGLVRDPTVCASGFDYVSQRQVVVPPTLSVADAILAISLAETASFIDHLGDIAHQRILIGGAGITGVSCALWCKMRGAAEVAVLARRPEAGAQACALAADRWVPLEADVGKRLAAEAPYDWYVDCIGVESIFADVRHAMPAARLAIYSVLQGFDEVPRFPVEEQRRYQWVCDLLARGIINGSQWMTHAWDFNAYQQAFAETDAGTVFKGWLRIGHGQ